MKGWIDIGSDVNWIDYHGKWARRARDGSWFVIDWTNMVDACGAECEDAPFVCEVKRVDLYELSDETIKKALDSCGVDLEDFDADKRELVKVEACVGYGAAQPLESFSGSKHPSRIRAEARRYAERCARDAALLSDRLDRQVNRIGSTAREYARGDIDSALNRGPFDVAKNIMRKIHGLTPA